MKRKQNMSLALFTILFIGQASFANQNAIYEQALWRTVNAEKTSISYCAYLEKYPNGRFAEMAKLYLLQTISESTQISLACELMPDEEIEEILTSTLTLKEEDNQRSSELFTNIDLSPFIGDLGNAIYGEV